MATELTQESHAYHDRKRVAYLEIALDRVTGPLNGAIAAAASDGAAGDAGNDGAEPAAQLGGLDLMVADLCLLGLRLIGPGRATDLERRAAFRDLKKLVGKATAAPFEDLLHWAVVESIRKPNLAHAPAVLGLLSAYDEAHQTDFRRAAADLLFWFGNAVINQECKPTAAELQGLNRFRVLHYSKAHHGATPLRAPRPRVVMVAG